MSKEFWVFFHCHGGEPRHGGEAQMYVSIFCQIKYNEKGENNLNWLSLHWNYSFLLVEEYQGEEWEVMDSSGTTQKWNFSVAEKNLTNIALTSQP